jgi:hypothetical protein
MSPEKQASKHMQKKNFTTLFKQAGILKYGTVVVQALV